MAMHVQPRVHILARMSHLDQLLVLLTGRCSKRERRKEHCPSAGWDGRGTTGRSRKEAAPLFCLSFLSQSRHRASAVTESAGAWARRFFSRLAWRDLFAQRRTAPSFSRENISKRKQERRSSRHESRPLRMHKILANTRHTQKNKIEHIPRDKYI
jgi:hypothetical protein